MADNINALLAEGVTPSILQGTHAGYYSALARRENDQEQRRLAAQPDIPAARRGHPWEISASIEHVRDDLEMQMRRPVAVRRRCADAPNFLPVGYGHPLLKSIERILAEMAIQSAKGRRAW